MNVYSMDAREVRVFGIIKNLVVRLVVHMDIAIVMDIMVIDIPDYRGMLLSRKNAYELGGCLQMDLTLLQIFLFSTH
jgi:hypothetical protein